MLLSTGRIGRKAARGKDSTSTSPDAIDMHSMEPERIVQKEINFQISGQETRPGPEKAVQTKGGCSQLYAS